MLIDSARIGADDRRRWWDAVREDAVRSRLGGFRLHVERAKDVLRTFAARPGAGYVGVSWGKDSVTVAHLALSLDLTFPLVWIRVEPITNPDCALVRDEFLARYPEARYDEILVHCRRDARGWHATGTLEEGFAEAVRRHGTRHISGVRAVESGQRKRRMQAYGESTAATCAPIGWWPTADVFAYLHLHDLPVHPAYAMTQNGVWSRERLRVASIGGKRGCGHGRDAWERQYYPEIPR